MSASESEAIVPSDLDAAIMRVLEAEQRARRAVDRSQAEAREIRATGGARARAVAERAARRVARVHAWTDTQIAARLNALTAERAALMKADGVPASSERVAAAVRSVAAELVGAP